MALMLVLTATTGAQVGKKLTFTARGTTIGSSASNTVVLQDRLVQPRHAEVKQIFDRWFVVPLTSTGQGISLNGLPVNGQSRLNLHDQLTLGSVSYQVSFVEVAEEEAQRASGASSAVPRLGEYFIRRGYMTSKDVTRTLDRQNELSRSGTKMLFGQVAYDLGFVNRGQLDAVVADQRSDFNQRFLD